MFNHISIGVSDLDAARVFYDQVLMPLGYTRLANSERAIGYGAESPQFWLIGTGVPVPADSRSGLHFCFNAPSDEAVRAFHAAGLRHGGTDNGEPGIRPEYATFYYAAFIIDPDGYRLEAFHHQAGD